MLIHIDAATSIEHAAKNKFYSSKELNDSEMNLFRRVEARNLAHYQDFWLEQALDAYEGTE